MKVSQGKKTQCKAQSYVHGHQGLGAPRFSWGFLDEESVSREIWTCWLNEGYRQCPVMKFRDDEKPSEGQKSRQTLVSQKGRRSQCVRMPGMVAPMVGQGS